MGTYATSTAITVVGTALLLPVAMLPILAVVTRRYGALRGWPLFASVGLLGSSVALAAFTIFPLPDPATLECTGGSLSSYWETEWFASIRLIGDAWANVGFPAVLWSTAFLQVALNVAFFIPYGFFLHQVTRWSGVRVVLVGLATSALIEVTQGTGVFGLYPCPYRVLDFGDLIINTLGAAIGVLISVAVRRQPWSHPARLHDLQRPTVPRRLIAAGIDLGLLAFVAGGGQGGVGSDSWTRRRQATSRLALSRRRCWSSRCRWCAATGRLLDSSFSTSRPPAPSPPPRQRGRCRF